MRRGRSVLTIATSLVLLLGACGRGDDEQRGQGITVFAAASLTDAMTEVALAFERRTGTVTVDLSFGPSSGLREQILAGAPADVFVSADTTNLQALVDAGEADEVEVFARNRLQIAVPPGNPVGVAGLADLARSELLVGLCAPQVPCGALARRVLDAAGVEAVPDTEATDARALLTMIAAGDLDAGLVYVTDVLAANGDVDGVDLPAGADLRTDYAIGALARGGGSQATADFVDFVVTGPGRAILASHGFGSP